MTMTAIKLLKAVMVIFLQNVWKFQRKKLSLHSFLESWSMNDWHKEHYF